MNQEIQKQVQRIAAKATGAHGKTVKGENRSTPLNKFEQWKEENQERLKDVKGTSKTNPKIRVVRDMYKADLRAQEDADAAAREAVLSQKVDINTCTSEQLDYLKIVPSAVCQQIVSNRENQTGR